MKSVTAIFLLALVVGAARPVQNQTNPGEPVYVQNQVIVKFRDSSPDRAASRDPLTPSSRLKARIASIGAELWQISGMTVEEAIEHFKSNPLIEYVEPNYYVTMDGTFPNDARFDELWGLYNSGEKGGKHDADIDATNAWDIDTGTNVLIGVVDTGGDYNHEDLAANIFTNPNEIPNNGVDDDHNGYVDDVRGWDFVDDDNDPMDDVSHGTHVSGTIAAVGNNSVGIVGVCWSARILPLKTLDAAGRGTVFDAAQAIDYATTMGARITNHSWSASGVIGGETLRLSIENARDAGALVVTSAGNSRLNVDLFGAIPQRFDTDNIIAVANTTRDDKRQVWSSYGPASVDLGAPGTRILSCTPANNYSSYTGTSMSSPHVAGAAALIWSAAPELSYIEVKDLILSTTDPLPELEGLTVSGGRLNIGRALARLDSISPTPADDLVASAVANEITLQWTATGDDGLSGTARAYDLRYATWPLDETNFPTSLKVADTPTPQPSGSIETSKIRSLEHTATYYFALRTLDDAGNQSPLSNVATVTTGPVIPATHITVSPSPLVKTVITGNKATKSIMIENDGATEFEWRASLANPSFVPGAARSDITNPTGTTAGDEPRIPGYPHEGLLTDITILFDISHGQVQDSWDSIIADLEDRGAEVVENHQSITPPLLEDVDIVWLTDHQTYRAWSDDELAALSGWLSKGGGLLLEGDNEATVQTFNHILTRLATGIEFLATSGTPGVTENVAPHPTTNKLVAVTLDANLAQLSLAAPPAGVLISDGAGVPCVAYSTYGSGRILAMADEVFEDDRIESSRIAAEDNRLFARQVFEWLSHPLWLSLSSDSGILPAGGVQELPVLFDATGLSGGLYEADLIIESTDVNEGQVTVNAKLGVAAAPDIELSEENLNFDVVYRGHPVTRSLRVFNSGPEYLLVTDVSVDEPDFTPDVGMFVLLPNEGREIQVECDPSLVGMLSGSLTMVTGDPDEQVVVVSLTANVLDPPRINVDPAQMDETLYSDEKTTRTVTLTNTGLSDLTFDVSLELPEPSIVLSGQPTPPPADLHTKTNIAHTDELLTPADSQRPAAPFETLQPEDTFTERLNADPGTHFFDDFEDGDFDGWIERGAGEKEVTDVTAANFTRYSYHEFESPAGHANGVTRMLEGEKPSYISVHIRPGSSSESDGYFVLRDQSNSLIFYILFSSSGRIGVNAGHPGQQFDVPYEANRWYWFEFKNVDFEDKTFDYYLDKQLIKAGMPFTMSATGEGVRTIDLYNYSPDSQAWWDEIRFADGDVWLSVSPKTGILPPGHSIDVSLDIDATTQTGGHHELELVIANNDPVDPENRVSVSLDVIDVPNIVVRDSLIAFGEVVIGVPVSASFDAFNAGFEMDVVVTDVYSDPPLVTVVPSSFTLPPRDTEVLTATISPVSPGPTTGVITIESNDRDQSSLAVPFTAHVFDPPVLGFSPDSLVVDVDIGDTLTQIVTISNDGTQDAVSLELTLEAQERLAIGSWVPATWFRIDRESETLSPGVSVDIYVDFDASSVLGGCYEGRIVITHNALSDSPAIVPVFMNVHGVPSITVADSLDFGVVFSGHPTSVGLAVTNDGTDVLSVTDISIDGPEFTASPTVFDVPPTGVDTVTVTINPVALGLLVRTLSISNNDPANPTVEITLIADVQNAPISVVSRDSVTVTIAPDESEQESLALRNAGPSDLTWSVDLNFRFDNDGDLGLEAAAGDDAARSLDDRDRSSKETGSVLSLMDVLWYGDHGLGGIDLWSKMTSEIVAMGGSVTQSFDALTIGLLADYDILWLGDLASILSDEEKDAIVSWVRHGGSLLIEADNSTAQAEYNDLFQRLGANITYHLVGVPPGPAVVYPHETTFGVEFLRLLTPGARLTPVEPPAFKLVDDFLYVTVGAHATVEKGRLVVIADQIFHDVNIDVNDNRLFGKQVFQWLAGTRWLTVSPLSGVVAAGDSTDIGLTLDATGFPEGTYALELELTTNDPLIPRYEIPVRMNVSDEVSAARRQDVVPTHNRLYQNIPNPFNPTTTISYDVAESGRVTLTIYDVKGRRVRRIVDDERPAGRYRTKWDGRNGAGDLVASGVYFVRLELGTFVQTRKMIFLK
ncbi:MAG: S8 family serine peptidase [Candidatus Latescibacterota bacterium]|nr:MAG: S8 family serine peptidase [Candidatus Latescibacterota bacterium]